MRVNVITLVLVAVAGQLQILSPSELVEQTGDNRDGVLHYSVSMFGDILPVSNFTLTVRNSPGDNRDGCLPFDKQVLGPDEKLVWLVVRGNCTYSKKASNAQSSAAFAVLVYNNDEK